MKARYIALVVVAIALIGGGFLGHHLIGRNTERAVDGAVELGIREADLWFARKSAPMAESGAAWLERLYAEPEQAARLNRGFAALVAAWSRDLPRLRGLPFPSEPIDEHRLMREIDERFGAGAFALMAQQRERQRQAVMALERERRDLEDHAQRLAQEDMAAVAYFVDLYGRYPALGSRIVNGRVVEP